METIYEILSGSANYDLFFHLCELQPPYPYKLEKLNTPNWPTYVAATGRHIVRNVNELYKVATFQAQVDFTYRGEKDQAKVWGIYCTIIVDGKEKLIWVKPFTPQEEDWFDSGENTLTVKLSTFSRNLTHRANVQ